MSAWKHELRACDHCAKPFEPRREKQTYCTPACQNRAAVRRHRTHYMSAPATQLPEKPLQPVLTPLVSPTEAAAPLGPTRLRNGLINGIFADEAELAAYQRGLAELQGDYPIELDADGYPILPACLDRRPKPADDIAEAA
jgi:hypothetical protein